MKRITQFLEATGWHAFLLPVFYCLHQYVQYAGLLSSTLTVLTAVFLLLFFALCLVLFYRITRHYNRSLQVLTFLGFFGLFFGTIKDALATLPVPLWSRYSFLLPALFLIGVAGTAFILRKNDFRKSNLFQNLLLLLFISADVVTMFRPSFSGKQDMWVNQPARHTDSLPAVTEKPDIYYLVFDSYPGNRFLAQFHQSYNGGHLDTLRAWGFRVLSRPFSNYNRTAFSMASTLNFAYLKDIRANQPPESREYYRAIRGIDQSAVPALFAHHGYTIHNLSVFRFHGTPPLYREHFFKIPEWQVISYNTLPYRIRKDILWHFISGKWAHRAIKKLYRVDRQELRDVELQKRNYNDRIIDSLRKIPGGSAGPKFVYAHLYLPHPPYFYDKDGSRRELESVISPEAIDSKALFLPYLEYTNTVIQALVSRILRQSPEPPVIILQSDHGFRDFAEGRQYPEYYYENFAAFYFPDRGYQTLYDSLSNINTFPVVLNKYFHTALPMRKDSIVPLPYVMDSLVKIH